ncbi:MAG: acylphosphatase [Desulfobacteraceae bacterium]|nr:acylphosphatase [Desulfobacteraceae bacterium]
MPEKRRAHVIIHGRVQGVFFRANTREAAQRSGVSGWVRNRADGTVEAVIEGEGTAVDEMLKWCETGDPPASVTKVDVSWEDPTGEYSGFVITR